MSAQRSRRHEMQHRHRTTIIPLLLSTVLGVGCDTDESSRVNDDFRDLPGDCVAVKGDIGRQCHGPNCVVQFDREITCASDDAVENLQLALDSTRIWADFDADVTGRQALRVLDQDVAWVAPLPGLGFAGQAPDGTMYRYLDGAAYLYSTAAGWKQVAVPGLPVNYRSELGFHIRPDGVGGLHAWFLTGDELSGANRFATQQLDNSWQWTSLGSYDPNTVYMHADRDAWNRTYSLIYTLDWDPSPQILLNFAHWDDFPVGEPGEGLGRVANPPRPALGGDAPIATLREAGDVLSLLSIVDENNWTENEVVGTERVSGSCPLVYNANDPACPPCQAMVQGREEDAHQLARTSGGQLWAAWFTTDASVELEYNAEPNGQAWRCRAVLNSLDAQALGTLHLAELAADGTIGRSVQYQFQDAGFRPTSDGSRRDLAIAAYGDEVAVLFPSHHVRGNGLRMRLMVFDTSNIQ